MSDVEYTVNFGSDKSIQFVKLSMAEIERHGARLGEEIVRCRDCKHYHDDPYPHCDNYFTSPQSDGFCAWACRKSE